MKRKFLLNNLPPMFWSEHWEIEQVYLSADPEIIACFKKPASNYNPINHYCRTMMIIKGKDKELKFSISENSYYDIITTLGKLPLRKDYYVYNINGHKMEVFMANRDSIYAEIEFASKEEADNFHFPFSKILN